MKHHWRRIGNSTCCLLHPPQGDDVFPIPGTRSIKRLEENVAAAHLKLSKADLAELEAA